MASIRKLRQQRETERSAAEMVGLGWLDGRPSKARSRVARLIHLFKAADLLSKKLRDRNASLPPSPRHTPDSRQLLSTLNKINEIFALYRGTRALWVSERYDLEEMFTPNMSRLERDDTYYVETRVINYALDLLRRGSIQRLRVCRECRKWFYAITDHQKHCSHKCRQRFASHDLDFKERRRKYMKKYRRQERERTRHVEQISRRSKWATCAKSQNGQ
jgi:hypothetical protein